MADASAIVISSPCTSLYMRPVEDVGHQFDDRQCVIVNVMPARAAALEEALEGGPR
jgi:hypothetical protein